MSGAALSGGENGVWNLSGAVDFGTVPEIWSSLRPVIADHPEVTLSLRGVVHANSASLALMLEARELAERVGCDLKLVDLPTALLDLARMSQSETLIATER